MISQAYTVGVHGYVLVYSVTSPKRFVENAVSELSMIFCITLSFNSSFACFVNHVPI